ncbi:MAG: substrate-binding periplasmic protein [Aestuariibacter sp.]
MQSFAKILLCILFLTYSLNVKAANQLVLAADPWCPYNCEVNEKKQGFMLDIAKQVFKRTNYRIEYVTMPWARAIQLVRLGTIDGLVGVGRQEVKELVFPDMPLGVASHTFYTLPQSAWHYQGLESLEQIKLGVIQSYSYGDLNKRYIENNRHDKSRIQTATSARGLAQNIGMLRKGRVDVIVEDSNVLSHYFKRQNRKIELKAAGIVCDEEVFIAFSPHRKDAKKLAQRLSKHLSIMRRSGNLSSMLASYGIRDWHNRQLTPCFS